MKMPTSTALTDDEALLVADTQMFRKKAIVTAKIRAQLETAHRLLKATVAEASLAAPIGFDPQASQLVKGEHLEEFPYQYLDFPKHFRGGCSFTFRSLFWWGHHVVWAWLLEGDEIKRYKRHMIDRFHQLAGRGLELSLAPTLWEWKCGEGYTLPMSHDRKAQLAAVLAERSFFKVVRWLPLTDPRIQSGELPQLSCETFRAMLPIVIP